jgi:hypothetical protein
MVAFSCEWPSGEVSGAHEQHTPADLYEIVTEGQDRTLVLVSDANRAWPQAPCLRQYVIEDI